jgi:hypothetical protein
MKKKLKMSRKRQIDFNKRLDALLIRAKLVDDMVKSLNECETNVVTMARSFLCTK